ncbi:MAG: hypothetical protein U9R79_02810 [Armatimonadota bacterium]|nr:hypothetical protein [Armatimonadota bacterium]
MWMRAAAILLFVVTALPCAAQQMPRVELEDNRLSVDGEPFFPYGCWGVIESVESMTRHHFNCVHSGMVPVPDLLDDAAEHDFMIVSYPHAPGWSDRHEEHVLAVRDHPNLLAWNIGDDLRGEHVEQVRYAFEWIRERDRYDRPIMLDVIHNWDQYQWFDEMFCAYHYPLLKEPTLLDYQSRLRERHSIVGPETYLWTWAQAHVQIWYTQRYLDPSVKWCPSLYPDGSNVRMVAYSAMAAGCRGIMYFLNRYFTEEYHGVDRYAEAALVGCELEVIGPWLAQGTVGEELATSEPTLHAWPVRFPGGTLVLLAVITDDSQYHVDAAMVEGATVDLERALREGERVYELSLDRGVVDITGRAEGTTLRTGRVDMTGLLLLTDDEALVADAKGKMDELRVDAAQFATQAAGAHRDKVERVLSALEAAGYPHAGDLRAAVDDAGRDVALAREHIEQARFAAAFQAARTASRTLRHATYEHWQRMNTSPFVRDAEVLPNFYLAERYYPLVQELAKAKPSPNLLANPSFEETADGEVVGWPDLPAAHEQAGQRGLVGDARTGERALQFTSESPSIYQGEEYDWVTADARSALVPAQHWDALEATAWVRIEEDLQKTERGAVLEILGFDAEGAAAESWSPLDVEVGRVAATDGWEKLTVRTVITRQDVAQVAVRLGINGVGEAWFDDVTLTRRRAK